MKKKINKRDPAKRTTVKNGTSFGVVFDRDGDMDCSEELGKLLARFNGCKKTQKIKVSISVVKYDPEDKDLTNPCRDDETKIFLYGKLLIQYKKQTGKDFEPKQFKIELKKKKEVKYENAMLGRNRGVDSGYSKPIA